MKNPVFDLDRPDRLPRNAASRLLVTLSNIPTNSQMMGSFPEYFFPTISIIDEGHRNTLVIRGQLELQKIYEQAREELIAYRARNPALADVERILDQFKPLIYRTRFDQPFSPPNEPQMMLLRMCAFTLPEEAQLTAKLEELLIESIDDLASLASSHEIDPILASAILHLVDTARRAIELFDFHGAKGFEEAYKRMIGEAFAAWVDIQESDVPKSEKTADATSALERFLRIWGRVVRTLKPALQVLPLLAAPHATTQPTTIESTIETTNVTIDELTIAPKIEFSFEKNVNTDMDANEHPPASNGPSAADKSQQTSNETEPSDLTYKQ